MVVGLDADFRQCVGALLVRKQIVNRLVHVDAVERVVVLLLALTVDEWTSCSEVLGLRKTVGLCRDDARQKQRELREIATVERQSIDRRSRDDFADDRILGLEYWADRSDLDLFRSSTDRERDVHTRGLTG